MFVVRDEAHRIRGALDHAGGYADEIVVVDQASDDGTPAIVAAWMNEAIVRRHRSGFGFRGVLLADRAHGYCEASRGLGAAHTSSDWIFVLDADERATDELTAKLPQMLVAGYDGYRIMRTLYEDGAHVFTGDRQYRLFRRDRVRFLDELHTEPQPITDNLGDASFVGIMHERTRAEAIADELRYERILLEGDDPRKQRKLALNVRLAEERAKGAAL